MRGRRIVWRAPTVYIMNAMTDADPMECRQIAELLGDYLDGTLPKETRELIEWHIESCAPCVAFVSTYRGTIDAAKKLRETTIPPELKQRLLSVLRSRQAAP
jgi:anti-sigma factor RsiW